LPPRRRWQLAAGDAGGTITAWDLGPDAPRVRSICRGSAHGVYALAFSPDGALLASSGRALARLWDPATGQLLLSIEVGNYVYGLGFSPDGRRLAVGADQLFTSDGRVRLLDLHDGRGVRTLRGLPGRLARAVLSPDDRLVAALSDEWQVAVWERETGRLVAVLDAPPGRFSDNSGLSVSPDGRRVAFSSHREARLWDIETGRELDRWRLPIGMQDTLVFRGPDRLLLARAESTDPEVAPYGDTDKAKYPRHCAIYDLLGGDPTTPTRKIRDLNLGILGVTLSPDGTTVVLDGYVGHGDQEVRTVNAYYLATGARLWSVPSRRPRSMGGAPLFDPLGKVLLVTTAFEDDWNHQLLIEMPSGRLRNQVKGYFGVGPNATVWAARIGAYGQCLFEQGRDDSLLEIDIRTTPFPLDTGAGAYTRDGRFLMSPNRLDTVTVCDLAEIRHQLTKVGLGW
jgi:WD40 repeat protein